MNEQRPDAPKICFIAAVPLSLTAFMAPHVGKLSRFCTIVLVASDEPVALAGLSGANVTFEPLTIRRAISPWHDLKALVGLFRTFRRHRFHGIQSITPKAGLLAMIAGRLVGVPVRIHWFTGQVWATRRGASRLLLKTLDRILAKCATHLLADSESQRAFLIAEGIVKPGDVSVLGSGSVCGVDTDRFRPDCDARARVRADLGIGGHAVVALFLGRLHRDKGVLELALAFAQVARQCPDLHLLFVGPDEGRARDAIVPVLRDVSSRTHFVEQTDAPESYMAAADMLVLPSHREGFGTTVIEAAACGLPAIGTRIYGLTDAIADGISGLLVSVGDVPALAAAIGRVATDDDLRRTMGRKARERVQREFQQADVAAAFVEFYAPLLGLSRTQR